MYYSPTKNFRKIFSESALAKPSSKTKESEELDADEITPETCHSLFVWNLLMEKLNPVLPKSKRYEAIQAIKSANQNLALLENFLPRLFALIGAHAKRTDLLKSGLQPKDIQ